MVGTKADAFSGKGRREMKVDIVGIANGRKRMLLAKRIGRAKDDAKSTRSPQVWTDRDTNGWEA